MLGWQSGNAVASRATVLLGHAGSNKPFKKGLIPKSKEKFKLKIIWKSCPQR